ncbi:MAG: DUF507 family protein [Deltaproteobacteria bacterium]|nr:DUF507 family protein [Deltaproteobacteria bacterium]
MKLYGSKIPYIARDIIRTLTSNEQIEVSNREEAELDIQSVLKEYLRRDRETTEEAKDLIEKRGLPHGQFAKIKRLVADRKEHALGDDGVVWMATQILETFMQSRHIDEIFAEDGDLRRAMIEIINRHTAIEDELDEEVRKRIRNLQEGGSQWDAEYGRVMEQIKRKRGLSD